MGPFGAEDDEAESRAPESSLTPARAGGRCYHPDHKSDENVSAGEWASYFLRRVDGAARPIRL